MEATIQARIDPSWKLEIQKKCLDERVSMSTVLIKSLEAFMAHGKWWEPQDDAPVEPDLSAIEDDLRQQGLLREEA